MDLTTEYMGLELRSPLVASASPLTGEVESLKRLEAAGAAAVVLPSLFEEQIVHDSLEVHRMLETGIDTSIEADRGYFPELDDYNTGPDRYLNLVERAKQAVSIPVIASLNGTSEGGWVRYARLLQFAGADGLELNMYNVAADPTVTSAELEKSYCDLVATVRLSIDIPLAVKIGPHFTAMANFARSLVVAGANALVLFNRFYQPDLDLETLEVKPRLVLSSPEELRLPLRWIGILRGQLDASLALTTGVHSAADAMKGLLAGADVVMMTSALLRHGPEYVRTVEEGMLLWMEEREYESVRQLRGSVSQGSVPDPVAFERAGYLQTLASYSTLRPL